MYSKPNVIFISIDSLRRDYCSIYNSEEDTTPFLASLSDATVFNCAISPSVWTLQVHASVFTGLYPPEHGVLDKGLALGDHSTFAEVAKRYGFSANSFGTNGWLESGDILRGFNHFKPSQPGHVRPQMKEALEETSSLNLSGAFEKIRQSQRGLSEKIRSQLFRHQPGDYSTVEMFLDHVRTEAQPFCYFLHLNDVHYTYNPAKPFDRMFGSHSFKQRFRNRAYVRKLVDNRDKIYTGRFDFDTDSNQVMRDLYRGCIRQTDSLLEHLFSELKRLNMYKNTVIVLFGDHGDQLCHNNQFGHQFSVADSLIRVPLLIIDPTDTLASGVRSDIVQLNDLYPTLGSILGFQHPETRSVDLTSSSRETAFVYYSCPNSFVERLKSKAEYNDDLPPTRQYVAWESPSKKLVWYPEERTFAGPARNDNKIRERLQSHNESLVRIEQQATDEMSAQVEQNLQQLGYL